MVKFPKFPKASGEDVAIPFKTFLKTFPSMNTLSLPSSMIQHPAKGVTLAIVLYPVQSFLTI